MSDNHVLTGAMLKERQQVSSGVDIQTQEARIGSELDESYYR